MKVSVRRGELNVEGGLTEVTEQVRLDLNIKESELSDLYLNYRRRLFWPWKKAESPVWFDPKPGQKVRLEFRYRSRSYESYHKVDHGGLAFNVAREGKDEIIGKLKARLRDFRLIAYREIKKEVDGCSMDFSTVQVDPWS